MRLYLMRHGEAESKSDSDMSRILTRQGQSDVMNITAGFMKRFKPDIIASSPYIRAKQTAELVSRQLDLAKPVQLWDELIPSGRPSIVLDKITESGKTELMVVTHQPFISKFVDYLTGVEVGMGTASIVAIWFEELLEGCGEVEWIKHRS